MNPNPCHTFGTGERFKPMNPSVSAHTSSEQSRACRSPLSLADGRRGECVPNRRLDRPPGRLHRQGPSTPLAEIDPKIGRPVGRLLSLPEAAAYLNLSWWTTRELVMGGKLPAVRLPAPRATDGRMLRRILIDVRDLDALIAKWKDCST